MRVDRYSHKQYGDRVTHEEYNAYLNELIMQGNNNNSAIDYLINNYELLTKFEITEQLALTNQQDIADILSGTTLVDNASKLSGATLSKYDTETLQDDDNKVPTSQQVKKFVEAGLSSKLTASDIKAGNDISLSTVGNSVTINSTVDITPIESDILDIINGTVSVGDSNKLDGATLSKFITEVLQDSDTKVPTSKQVKTYVDSGLVSKLETSNIKSGNDISVTVTGNDVTINSTVDISSLNTTVSNIINGSQVVGNATQFNGNTLSKYSSEALQDNDDKVPTSKQVKEFVDVSLSDKLIATNIKAGTGIAINIDDNDVTINSTVDLSDVEWDIDNIINGTQTVGNSLQLDGASLSKFVTEVLQDNDAKVPTSKQVKEYVDSGLSTRLVKTDIVSGNSNIVIERDPVTNQVKIFGEGGGSGGTLDHAELINRSAADQHPINAITGLQAALDSKQATLISGTNLKTLLGESLLGSEDITIDHSSLSGRDAADQHTIGSITNLQSTLNSLESNKQDTLVSGTNIKTVNGTSVLGSGDIVTPNTTYSEISESEIDTGTASTTRAISARRLRYAIDSRAWTVDTLIVGGSEPSPIPGKTILWVDLDS